MTIVGITGKPIPPEVNRRIRLYALATFLIVALFCTGTAYWQAGQTAGLRHAQRANYGNCLAIQSVVDQTVRNVRASTALGPAAKAQALATYETLSQQLDCDGLKP